MIYEAISDVNIRREPRIIEINQTKNNLLTNRVGMLSAGTQREVFSIITDKNNDTWGRISQADGAGKAEWVCIANTNRVFMRKIEIPEPVHSIFEWADAIDAWARNQGYKGVSP
jgi:hypothetical protein